MLSWHRTTHPSPKPFFPLQVYVCDACKLVQARDVETPGAIFSDYAYFSGFAELV